jgi:hypothetical protein
VPVGADDAEPAAPDAPPIALPRAARRLDSGSAEIDPASAVARRGGRADRDTPARSRPRATPTGRPASANGRSAWRAVVRRYLVRKGSARGSPLRAWRVGSVALNETADDRARNRRVEPEVAE